MEWSEQCSSSKKRKSFQQVQLLKRDSVRLLAPIFPLFLYPSSQFLCRIPLVHNSTCWFIFPFYHFHFIFGKKATAYLDPTCLYNFLNVYTYVYIFIISNNSNKWTVNTKCVISVPLSFLHDFFRVLLISFLNFGWCSTYYMLCS